MTRSRPNGDDRRRRWARHGARACQSGSSADHPCARNACRSRRVKREPAAFACGGGRRGFGSRRPTGRARRLHPDPATRRPAGDAEHTAPVRPAPTPIAGGTAHPCGITITHTGGSGQPLPPELRDAMDRDGRTTTRPLGAGPAEPGVRAGGGTETRRPFIHHRARHPPRPDGLAYRRPSAAPRGSPRHAARRSASTAEYLAGRGCTRTERHRASSRRSSAVRVGPPSFRCPGARPPRCHRRRPQQALVPAPRLGGDRRRRRTVTCVAQLHSRRDSRSPDPRLEDKYVTRLLDNLPDRDKTSPQYTRIIQALGPRTAGLRREPSLPWPVRLRR